MIASKSLAFALVLTCALTGCTRSRRAALETQPAPGPVPGQPGATPGSAGGPGAEPADEQALGAAAGLSTAQMAEGRLFVNGWNGLQDELPAGTGWNVEDGAGGGSQPPPAQPPGVPPAQPQPQPQPQPPASGVTYVKDVAPILQTSCVPCHRPGGSRSVSSMTDYASAKSFGGGIVSRVEGGSMPPSGGLSVAARATLRQWQEAGYPEGGGGGGVSPAAGAQPGSEQTADGSVVFRIRKGTGNGPWNTQETEVVAKVGKPFIIINDDDITHQWHTNGRPCFHGLPIAPGRSAQCVPSAPFSSGPLYDHITLGRFYIRAE